MLTGGHSLIAFREREEEEREGKRERLKCERRIDWWPLVCAWIGDLMHKDLGSNLQPGYVP